MANIYSTAEVARICEVEKSTLLRWLYAGKLAEPARRKFGGVVMRMWSEQDLARARKFKAENYWKPGRGHKKKSRGKRS